MEQRALECQPLSHAPRIRSNPIVGAVLEPRVTERGGDARVAIRQSIQPPIKLKVFSPREVVVEKLVVAEHADARTQAVAKVVCDLIAVPHFPAARSDECRQHAEQRRFASAIRSEESHDVAGGMARHVMDG